ncbi:ATP-dependent helicase [Escherichia phage vB_EcoS_swan01]|uniref:ATP-dependent helicase n=1 Tax=Escherichia phage vB_EcoS_swan01 TaxID=2496549 RepID=A0A1X7QGP4_9CAUD|nr:ATP-dependent helicase [Escherichia phage vB_EcoS_swan01]SMH63967.1 ATP-dependent helicase [Escherichia phage vB_EcoS_swan01]
MIPNIEKQISALGEAVIKSIQERFTVGNIVPYPYQCVAYAEIAKRMKNYEHPFFVKASVSAGKTLMFAMVAAQCRKMGLKMMVLARQAEIVDQDSEEISNLGVPNSIYCAGLKTKSAYFPIVVGSEGTVVNGLFKSLGDYVPHVIGIDECHQVDWEDLADAIENNESYQQMTTKKDLPVLIGEEQQFDSNGDPMFGTGRTQYTVIIMEMMRRCREAYGHELRIFGMTGSEFRGVVPILVEDKNKNGFWREQVTNIDTNYLIKFGSVVPTNFGDVGDLGYDLSEFEASSEDGVSDFDAKTLRKMEEKIHQDATMTQKIMAKVHEICKDRNGVLVTCAGERHCKEAAAALPPGVEYRIITGKTGDNQRKEWLREAYEGKVKYIFQVQALTTGVNVPFWDTSVILRKIGSLTLLIQLLGRGMRLLKQWHIEQGFKKKDHLVLDFAGTMDELGDLYFDPILEQAQFQKRFTNGKEPKTCPICGTLNSFYARRCMHVDDNGKRCEHFWTYRICEDQVDQRTKKIIKRGCGTKNDVVARVCRCCDISLVDPNEKLSGKHYTKNDWCNVKSFRVDMTKNQKGIIFCYELEANGDTFKAYERFFPESESNICRTIWRKIALQHIPDRKIAGMVASYRNARKIMSYAHHIMPPVRVTHRKNGKGEDNIAKREFV